MADDLSDLFEIWDELRPPQPPRLVTLTSVPPEAVPPRTGTTFVATRTFSFGPDYEPRVPRGTRLTFDGNMVVIPGSSPRELPALQAAIRQGWLVPVPDDEDEAVENPLGLPPIEQLVDQRPQLIFGGGRPLNGRIPMPRRFYRMRATLSPTGQIATWDAPDEEDPQGLHLRIPPGLSIIPGSVYVLDRGEQHERWSD